MKCQNCELGIFDPNWGEWKCKKNAHRVYVAEEVEYCKDYKQKPKTKK